MPEQIELRCIKFRWENRALLIKQLLPRPLLARRTCNFFLLFLYKRPNYQHQTFMQSAAFLNKNAAEIAWIFYEAPTYLRPLFAFSVRNARSPGSGRDGSVDLVARDVCAWSGQHGALSRFRGRLRANLRGLR